MDIDLPIPIDNPTPPITSLPFPSIAELASGAWVFDDDLWVFQSVQDLIPLWQPMGGDELLKDLSNAIKNLSVMVLDIYTKTFDKLKSIVIDLNSFYLLQLQLLDAKIQKHLEFLDTVYFNLASGINAALEPIKLELGIDIPLIVPIPIPDIIVNPPQPPVQPPELPTEPSLPPTVPPPSTVPPTPVLEPPIAEEPAEPLPSPPKLTCEPTDENTVRGDLFFALTDCGTQALEQWAEKNGPLIPSKFQGIDVKGMQAILTTKVKSTVGAELSQEGGLTLPIPLG